jgi:hypothetical protein
VPHLPGGVPGLCAVRGADDRAWLAWGAMDWGVDDSNRCKGVAGSEDLASAASHGNSVSLCWVALWVTGVIPAKRLVHVYA